MERFSRELLAALACAAAGPLCSLIALHLALGPLLDLSLTGEGWAAVLTALLQGLVLLLAVGALASLVGTAVALVATRCPHPLPSFLACLLLTPVWLGLLGRAGAGDLGLLLGSGLVAGAVRLVAGLSVDPSGGPAAG